MNKYIQILKYINNIVILHLLLIIISVVCTQQSFAQEVPKQYLSVSPIIEDVNLVAGKPFTYKLDISNHAAQPLGIHIDLSPFDPDNLANPSQTNQSVLPWTILSQTDFIVPEKSTSSILITLKPPTNVKDSGYYGAFILTPFISQQKQHGTPIILTRFIAVVFATLGQINYDNLTKKVMITNFKPVSYFIDDQKPFDLTFTVNNQYFTHFIAKPFLTIKPLLSKSITAMPEEKHIFPGRERVWNVEGFPTNRIFYTADLAISIGNGKQIIEHTHFILISKYFLYIFGSLLLTVFLILLRKRLLKAIQVIINGK